MLKGRACVRVYVTNHVGEAVKNKKEHNFKTI